MRSRDSKRLVVNASVARAAGGEDATVSVSINCTEFLETFRDECPHHVVMTPELSEEWEENQSKFAATWLASMIAKKRFYYDASPENQVLCNTIEQTATNENEVKEMWDDFHLLEAALKADQTIISLDRSIRELFARATRHVSEIRDIVWVNPEYSEEEEPLDWLKNGAPPEDYRKLRAWPHTLPEK